MILILWPLVSWLLTATWTCGNGYFQIQGTAPYSSFGFRRPNWMLTPARAPVHYVKYPSYYQEQYPSYEITHRHPYPALPYVHHPITTATATTPRSAIADAQMAAYYVSGQHIMSSLGTGGYPEMQPSFGYRPTTYLSHSSPMGLMMPFPDYSSLMQGQRKTVVNRIINNNMNINTGTQGVARRRQENNSLGLQTNRTTTNQEITYGSRNATETITKEVVSSQNSTELVRPGTDSGSIDRESTTGTPDAGTGNVAPPEENTLTEQEKADRYNQLLREYKKFLEQSGKNDVLISGMKKGQTAEAYFETKEKFVENTFYSNFSTSSMNRTVIKENIDAERVMPPYF
ncbi:hypothetical protein FHG87_007501 [Trinorchestia longiramus]|nr:hypothetical protein FHG87_007501 [Trinorchestia longiramus]